MYAADGIGAHSAGELRAFSKGCIGAIAIRARLISDRLAGRSFHRCRLAHLYLAG